MFAFTVLNEEPETGTRAGKIVTDHGEIATPAFIPVGTQATIKALIPEELREIGAEIVLCNTYHLYHPTRKTRRKEGG